MIWIRDQITCHVQICLLDSSDKLLFARAALSFGGELRRWKGAISTDLPGSSRNLRATHYVRAHRRTAQFSRNHRRCGSFVSLAYTRTYKRWPFVPAFYAGDLRSGTYVTNPRWSAWLRTQEPTSGTCKCTLVTTIDRTFQFRKNMRNVPPFRHRKPSRYWLIKYTGVSREALRLILTFTQSTRVFLYSLSSLGNGNITRTHGCLINVSQSCSHNLLKLTKV